MDTSDYVPYHEWVLRQLQSERLSDRRRRCSWCGSFGCTELGANPGSDQYCDRSDCRCCGSRPQEESVVDQLAAVPEEERADALRTLTIINTIKELGYWAIAAVLAFFLIPLLVGYFIPRRSERKMKEMLFDNPDIKMRDLK